MREPAFDNPRAETARLRHLYRALVLRGRLRLPAEAARPLLGPDCAYHLYGFEASTVGTPCAVQPRKR